MIEKELSNITKKQIKFKNIYGYEKKEKKLLINYLNNLMKQKLLKKKKKIKIELSDYIIIDIKLFDI